MQLQPFGGKERLRWARREIFGVPVHRGQTCTPYRTLWSQGPAKTNQDFRNVNNCKNNRDFFDVFSNDRTDNRRSGQQSDFSVRLGDHLKDYERSKELTAPKQRPGTRPWWKKPNAMSDMAGTALMIANTSFISKGPSRGLWCDWKTEAPQV